MSMAASRNVFDSSDVAGTYDRWFEKPRGRVYDRLESRALAAALPDPSCGDALLEVGCGTGHWAEIFDGHGFRVTGVDLSGHMLTVARRRHPGRISLQRADATRLPFRDGSFDVAVAITALEYIVDPNAAIAEMTRCVRPGGKIILGVLNRRSSLGVMRRLRSRLGRSSVLDAAHFFSLGELRRLGSAFGSVKISSTVFVLPWRWTLPVAPALDLLGRGLRLPFGDFLVAEIRR